VQGHSDDQRELLDAESVAGHLLKPGSVFGFLAAHRRELFPEEMFADLFPTRRGRPSVPAEVMASVITLQALHGLSDNETVDAVTFDLPFDLGEVLIARGEGRMALCSKRSRESISIGKLVMSLEFRGGSSGCKVNRHQRNRKLLDSRQ